MDGFSLYWMGVNIIFLGSSFSSGYKSPAIISFAFLSLEVLFFIRLMPKVVRIRFPAWSFPSIYQVEPWTNLASIQ